LIGSDLKPIWWAWRLRRATRLARTLASSYLVTVALRRREQEERERQLHRHQHRRQYQRLLRQRLDSDQSSKTIPAFFFLSPWSNEACSAFLSSIVFSLSLILLCVLRFPSFSLSAFYHQNSSLALVTYPLLTTTTERSIPLFPGSLDHTYHPPIVPFDKHTYTFSLQTSRRPPNFFHAAFA
jgi:hypothetical protein